MLKARKIGVRTSRSQYTRYPPSRMAPAIYAARGKMISRRGAFTGDFLQLLTMGHSWDLLIPSYRHILRLRSCVPRIPMRCGTGAGFLIIDALYLLYLST